jgi:2-dehydropantoate 2-reductase
MRIAIVGAGAVGLWLGSYLSAFADVCYVTRREQQAKCITANGIRLIKEDGTQIETDGKAVSLQAALQMDPFSYDLVVVTVKQHQLESVMEWLENGLTAETPILFLMNGM